MKLGTRVTVVTTLLVAPVLGASGFAALQLRRSDLEQDLDRQAAEVAEMLRVGDRWQTSDQSWRVLAQAAEIEDGPVGRLLEAPGREPAYAMAVPLQDTAGMSLPQHHPGRLPKAMIGMRRDARYIKDAVAAAGGRIFSLFL